MNLDLETAIYPVVLGQLLCEVEATRLFSAHGSPPPSLRPGTAELGVSIRGHDSGYRGHSGSGLLSARGPMTIKLCAWTLWAGGRCGGEKGDSGFSVSYQHHGFGCICMKLWLSWTEKGDSDSESEDIYFYFLFLKIYILLIFYREEGRGIESQKY
uniref:Uncharacterized protein n=1 Tax=Pipistrellus kuhlii TaxID=59472 RepID=A0A7J7V0J8_PIPKU|nr:hypothetical protein mPipKuh1_008667 [Pipistrellus kuhlii]